MKKLTAISRRRFLGSSALVSAAAMGASSLSLAAGIKRRGRPGKKVFERAPLFDPALENYPGYSARIPVPSTSEPEAEKEPEDSLFSGM